MKKILMAGVALAMMAGSASAQSLSTQTYGQDGQAWWAIGADVNEFCRINSAAPQVSVTRATATPGVNGQGGSISEADGTISLDIQDPNNNAVQAAYAAVNYANSQCNTTFELTAESQNKGLTNNAYPIHDPEFISTVPYNIRVNFDGVTGATPASGANGQVLANGTPKYGTFMFAVHVAASADYLLEGEYRDFLKVVMRPTV